MGRDILGIINNRNIHVYCVTGIDVYLADGSKDTTFQGYTKPDVDPITGQTVISIYMTETMSGVAWAGLLAHEISHIINPCRIPMHTDQQRREIEELWAYQEQVRVLNQLYFNRNNNFNPQVMAVLKSFPFINIGREAYVNEWVFFNVWIPEMRGYQQDHKNWEFHSKLRINPGKIELLLEKCINGQCTCQCHQ